MLEKVSFCCASVNGEFICKQSATGESPASAAVDAFNMLLFRCDPLTARWIMITAERKITELLSETLPEAG